MLDAKFIRDNEGLVRESLQNRHYDLSVLEKFLELDKRWRALTEEGNALRKKRNEVSDEIPKLSKEQKQARITEMKAIGDSIRTIEGDVKKIEGDRDELLLNIPNVPDSTVPVGKLDEGDKFLRTWGDLRKFDFKPQKHWELGEKLDIIDF